MKYAEILISGSSAKASYISVEAFNNVSGSNLQSIIELIDSKINSTILTSESSTYYYKGYNEGVNWRIRRYLSSNLNVEEDAYQAINPSYLDLASAWNDREILVYL